MALKRRLFVVLLTVALLVPVGWAAPVILPTSSSLVSVDSADTFAITCFTFGSLVSYSFTGPGGQTLTVQQSAVCPAGSNANPVPPCVSVGTSSTARWSVFRFDGAQVSGDAVWTVQGDLTGTPLDGTWQVRLVVGTAVCMALEGKQYQSTIQTTLSPICFYNWRHAGATYTSANSCAVPTTIQENPNEATFFSDQAPQDPDPDPFATLATVTCPSSLLMRGDWIRGASQVGNTFVRFVVVEGLETTDGDLRDNLGAEFTALVDDGALSAGQQTETVAYNNAVGNSFQLLARAGATGQEQVSNVFLVPAGQCGITPPSLLGFSYDPDEFHITVSQAQCRDDKVAFSINVGVTQTLNMVTVFIRDTETNVVALQVTTPQMFHVPSSGSTGIYFFNRTLGPGPWVATARGDFGGLGAVDFFDSQAFNVPEGSCLTPGDKVDLDDHCIPLQDDCSGEGGAFIQGTTLGQTTVENVLLLLLIFLICWYIWARSTSWEIKFLIPLIVVLLFLATLTFVDKWPPIGLLAALFMFGGVAMIYRTSHDFIMGRREQRRQKRETGSTPRLT